MTISGFFEHRLGAPLRNVIWSWGATSPSTGHVYLRVWDHEFDTVNGRRCVLVTDGPHAKRTSHGDRERHAHVQVIQRGAKAFCVVLTAVDPKASRPKIKSFNTTELMVGGAVIEDDSGRLWLEDAGRCGVPSRPASDEQLPASPPPVASNLRNRLQVQDRRFGASGSRRPESGASASRRQPSTARTSGDMDTGEVRRRVRRTIDDSRARARERRRDAAAAEVDGGRVLRAVAAPLFRTVASALKAEGYRFGVETPAGAVRLSRGGSSEDVIELALDTTRDPPAMMGRTAYVSGRRVLSDERIVAEHPALADLRAEDLLDFVLSALVPMVER